MQATTIEHRRSQRRRVVCSEQHHSKNNIQVDADSNQLQGSQRF